MKISLVLLVCLLAGCESTRNLAERVTAFAKRHPVATRIGAGLFVGSIAASAHHGDSNNQQATGAAIGPGPSCTPQPNGSCR